MIGIIAYKLVDLNKNVAGTFPTYEQACMASKIVPGYIFPVYEGEI